MHSDINNSNVLFSLLPVSWHKYLILMRLDRPVGFLLTLYPALWGMFLGFYQVNMGDVPLYSYGQLIFYCVIFLIGAIFVRSFGCIVNDLVDIKIDRQVERTKLRPLASGEISIIRALILMIFMLLCSALLLYWFPLRTFYTALLIVPFIVLYPFGKRFFILPQLILGLVFNYSYFIAISIFKPIEIYDLPLYIGSVLWCIGYDTIYAHQDKKYDKKLKLKSGALLFGENTKKVLVYLYGLFIALALFQLDLLGIESTLFVLLLLVVTIRLYWQLLVVELDNIKSTLLAFKSNILTGFIMTLAIIVAII